MRAALAIVVLAVLVGTTACSGSAAPAPGPGPAAPGTEADVDPVAGDGAQEQQARTVAAEDARIYAVSGVRPGGSTAYVAPAVAPSIVPTVVLTARPAPYDLTSLAALGGATRRPDGGWDLLMSVVVERGATLRIAAPGSLLRMASGTVGFTSIVAVKGTVELAGEQDRPLSIASWDPVTGLADAETADGRSYLRAAGGRLDLTDVSAADLGFWSGRTGGVAWTGSQTEPATGAALRTVVERSQYGMYATRTAGLVIDSGAVRDNELDGLLVHRLAADTTVRHIEVSRNGRNGITVSAGATRVLLSEITARANAVAGIRIDGAPRTDSAGTMSAPGRAFVVERSVLSGNLDIGIVADTAAELTLADNSVTGSPDGIVVSGAAPRQEVRGNIVEATDFGIAVRDGVTEALLTGNTVRTATIALQVTDARADLQHNIVGGARHYAVSLTGNSGGSTVAGNRLGGQGPSAVDTLRVGPGPAVTIGPNDERGWLVERESGGFLTYLAEHPLLLLWSLILVLPVAAGLRTRHRRRGPDTAAAEAPLLTSVSAPDPDEAETTLGLPITRVTVVSEVSA